MGLERYRRSRIRFTWRGRRVDSSTPHSQNVLEKCKNQRGYGGKCLYFGVTTALESHNRIKTNMPCDELSWKDLEEKVCKLKVDGTDRMVTCFNVLKTEGVRYEAEEREDKIKVQSFELINTRNMGHLAQALKHYMRKGPMVGVFEVWGEGFDEYGQAATDDIYFANRKVGHGFWTHCVVITGFGEQGKYPFWEFQNSYGPDWRGAARGFGQICAVHLRSLVGFKLSE